jgi:hypothetical protein
MRRDGMDEEKIALPLRVGESSEQGDGISLQ